MAGPLLVQATPEVSGAQRIGLLPISGLLLAGLLKLQWVRGGDQASAIAPRGA